MSLVDELPQEPAHFEEDQELVADDREPAGRYRQEHRGYQLAGLLEESPEPDEADERERGLAHCQ